MNNKFVMNYAFIWLFALLISGCGFHLRGLIDMPTWLRQVAVVNQGSDRAIEPLLRDQLQAYHVQVCSDPALAEYWLILNDENFQQQISSVSSSTTPRQYQLIYTINYNLQTRKGKPIIPQSIASVTRQLTINSDRILGSNDEEATIKNEMRRDAVMQILNRLSRRL